MTRAELGGRLLSQVSRSFYLSIRLLPRPLREPIGLAYLLARASDTIADSGSATSASRLRHLQDLSEKIASACVGDLSVLQQEIRPDSAGEVSLIAHLGEALQWLRDLDEAAREEIQRVLAIIIRGQVLDLQRFSAQSSGRAIAALGNAAELEEYTYLVTGCVGEFWTRISLQRLGTRYSAMEAEELCDLGRQLGKALQLVNILRDLPADLRQGRCYLPQEELAAVGTSPSELLITPAAGRAVFDRWLHRTSDLLRDGYSYIAAIKPLQVRAACYLPWYLAEATVKLMQKTPPLETSKRVKVPRRVVYAGLWRAFASSSSQSPHRPVVPSSEPFTTS